MDLSEADVELLLAAVGVISEPGSLEQLRTRSMTVIAELVAADSCTWNEIHPDSGVRVVVAWPDIATAELVAAFDAHLHEHPVIVDHRRTGDGRPQAVSDLVGQDEFRTTGLYRAVFAPLGVEDQIAFVLPDPDVLVGIACNGTWEAFGARERSLLNLTRPHLVRARRDAVAYDRTRWYLDTVDGLLERDGEGLLLVDAEHRVEYVTPNAGHIMASWFDVPRAGVLPAPVTTWLSSGAADPLVVETAGRRLHARRLPGPDRATTAVLLRESGLSADGLARLRAMGLTRREAEVVHLVADGLTNAAIAARLHLSERTVEQHVGAALNKLGATNRTQAARLLRDG